MYLNDSGLDICVCDACLCACAAPETIDFACVA